MIAASTHLAFAASLCAAPLLAQQPSPARDLGFGMVRQSDGTPWPGALVQLVHRPDPELLDESITDRIEVFTDERGRFRAEVLDGARYAVWARAPLPDELGRYRATAHAALEVRTPVVLDEAEPRFSRRIRVVPDPSWEGHETLRLFATAGESGLGPGRWISPDEQGVLHLPTCPDDRLHVELYAGGWRVHRTALALSPSALRSERPGDAALLGTAEGTALALGQELSLAVPPRQVRTHRLMRKDNGEPVRDAIALVEPAPAGAPLPRSDDDGRLDVVFASEVDVVDGTRVRAVLAGETTESSEVSSAGWSLGIPSVERRLGEGRTLRGRLLVAGTPTPDVPLHAWIVDPQQRTHSGRSLVVRADRAGDFAIPGLTSGERISLTAVLPVTVRERLAQLWSADAEDADGRSAPIAPVVALADLGWLPGEGFGVLDLADFRRVRVRVERDGGSPAGAVSLWCCTAPPDATRISPAITYRTSRHGTLRVACRAGSRPAFVAESDGLVGALRLDPHQRDALVPLDPRSVARIRLVDAAGDPLPGREITAIPGGRDHGLGTDGDGPLTAAMQHALRGRTEATTGEDGSARLSLRGREGVFSVVMSLGSQRHEVVGVLDLAAERDPDQILQVRVKDPR